MPTQTPNVEQEPCPGCQGQRLVPNVMTRQMQGCPLCYGSGTVDADFNYQPFSYAVQVVLTGNATGAGKIQIDTDADFKWLMTSHAKTGNATVQVTEPSKASRQWMSLSTVTGVVTTGIRLDNWAGTAQLPAYLYIPYILKKQASLLFSFTDLSGAGNTVEVALIGYKLFPKAA